MHVSYSTLFQSDLLSQSLELVLFRHVPYVLECHMGLRNISTCLNGIQALEDGATSCHVKYVTLSFLTFFQFGENTQ